MIIQSLNIVTIDKPIDFKRVTKIPEEEEEDDVEENDIEEDDFGEETNFCSGTNIPFDIERENVNNFVR